MVKRMLGIKKFLAAEHNGLRICKSVVSANGWIVIRGGLCR